MTGKKLLNVGTVVNDEHIKDLVEKILVDVDEKFSLDFTADEYLKDGLALHLRIAIARVKFRVNIRNELLGSVKKEYPLAFQIAVYAAKMVRDIDHIEFNENEIGYIALHFGASMSRNSMAEEERSKTVYVVCSAGLGVSVLMKAKLKENFRNSIHVIDILPAYKLTEKCRKRRIILFLLFLFLYLHQRLYELIICWVQMMLKKFVVSYSIGRMNLMQMLYGSFSDRRGSM